MLFYNLKRRLKTCPKMIIWKTTRLINLLLIIHVLKRFTAICNNIEKNLLLKVNK